MAQHYIMLFQYGSNMDPNRLNCADRLDGAAEVIGVARLKSWGVTDIVPSRREHVDGVLYRVPYRKVIAPRGQQSEMDKVEGAGLGERSNYKRQKILVWKDGKKIEARTYI